MGAYPRTIDDGAGERLTFVAVRRDDRGEYIELRNSVDHGAGPPMHAHHLQEEGLTIERGTLARLVGLHRRYADAPKPMRRGASNTV